jgi:NADH-quinone oxidoreductase subunit E
LKQFERLLGIKAGSTTADDLFTLLPCCCLGNCGNAPSVMVGERIFGPISPKEAESLLENLLNTHP